MTIDTPTLGLASALIVNAAAWLKALVDTRSLKSSVKDLGKAVHDIDKRLVRVETKIGSIRNA